MRGARGAQRRAWPGSDQFGAARRDDIVLRMPVGTIISDAETGQVLAELLKPGEQVCSPRAATVALATCTSRVQHQPRPAAEDAGLAGREEGARSSCACWPTSVLLGMPNAGKSTLIAAISNADRRSPTIPFTTLHPNLGVVRVGPEQSFVVADVPGLIEGASEGAGLGHQFLRHLQRTRVLLHMVDVAPFDDASTRCSRPRPSSPNSRSTTRTACQAALAGAQQARHGAGRGSRCAACRTSCAPQRWKGPVFEISALTRQGCEPLMRAVYQSTSRKQEPVRSVTPRTRCRASIRSLRT
jgi:GTP-binding protein